jgi:hypothetical protein
MLVGQMLVDQMLVSQMLVGQMSVGQMVFDEMKWHDWLAVTFSNEPSGRVKPSIRRK